jgi:hypothetical protein
MKERLAMGSAIVSSANNGCCGEPTLVIDEFCGNYTTVPFVVSPPFFGVPLWFDQGNQSGTFTLSNDAISTGIAQFTFLDSSASVVAAFFVPPGDSTTVTLSGVSTLFVASFSPGTTVTGKVCIKIFRHIPVA